MKTEADLLKLAHAMRRDPTEPEIRLWRVLSNGQLGGFKFRRQHVIVEAQAIVDFFCPAIGLCVEVDGHTHDPIVDQRRDLRVAMLGFSIERFSNLEVMTNIEGVVHRLRTQARSLPQRWPGRQTPPPQPLP